VNFGKVGLTPTEKRMLTTAIYFGTMALVNTADKKREFIK
jgi:hypothetical protein